MLVFAARYTAPRRAASCDHAQDAAMGSAWNAEYTAVGFEPTPLQTGTLSQRLRPLGRIVMLQIHLMQGVNLETQCLAALQGAAKSRSLRLQESGQASRRHVFPEMYAALHYVRECSMLAGAIRHRTALHLVTTLRMLPWAQHGIPSNSCGVRTHALTDWRLKPAP